MNKIKFMILAMVAMLTLGFASCSSSSDDSNSPAQPSNKVQSVELKFKADISADLANFFNLKLEWYDENGSLQSKQLDGTPIELDVKYDLTKASVVGFRIVGQSCKVNPDPEKLYNATCNSDRHSFEIVKNGEKETMQLSVNMGVTNYGQLFATRDKVNRFGMNLGLTGTKSFIYKVTDSGLERVTNN